MIEILTLAVLVLIGIGTAISQRKLLKRIDRMTEEQEKTYQSVDKAMEYTHDIREELCNPHSDTVSRGIVLNKKVHRIMVKLGADEDNDRVRSDEKSK